MTAILAAAGRAVAGAVLVLVCVAAMLFTAFGPHGAWTLAWIVLAAAVVGCAALALLAVPPESGSDGAYPEDWQERGWCCRDCAAAAWHDMTLELRGEYIRGSDE